MVQLSDVLAQWGSHLWTWFQPRTFFIVNHQRAKSYVAFYPQRCFKLSLNTSFGSYGWPKAIQRMSKIHRAPEWLRHDHRLHSNKDQYELSGLLFNHNCHLTLSLHRFFLKWVKKNQGSEHTKIVCAEWDFSSSSNSFFLFGHHFGQYFFNNFNCLKRSEVKKQTFLAQNLRPGAAP